MQTSLSLLPLYHRFKVDRKWHKKVEHKKYKTWDKKPEYYSIGRGKWKQCGWDVYHCLNFKKLYNAIARSTWLMTCTKNHVLDNGSFFVGCGSTSILLSLLTRHPLALDFSQILQVILVAWYPHLVRNVTRVAKYFSSNILHASLEPGIKVQKWYKSSSNFLSTLISFV